MDLNLDTKVTRRGFIAGGAAAGAISVLGVEILNEPGAMRPAVAKAAGRSASDPSERTVYTACTPNCGGNDCPLKVTVRDGKMVRVAKVEFPDRPYVERICVKGLSRLQFVYAPDRLKYPLKRVGPRGSGKFQRISWQEAFDTVGAAIQKAISQYGPQSIGMAASSGSGNSLNPVGRLGTALGATYITGGIDQGVPWADIAMLGGNSSPAYEDFKDTHIQIFWGNNILETTMGMSHFMADAKQNGTRIIVIEPRYSLTAAMADEWIPIEPGTDAALALGMANVILSRKLEDRTYLRKYSAGPILVRSDTKMYLRQSDVQTGGSQTVFMAYDSATKRIVPVDQAQEPALDGSYTWNGVTVRPSFELLKERIAEYPVERAAAISKVPAATIERLAVAYATQKPSVIRAGYGFERWSNGDQSSMAIYTLPLLTGNIGVSGSGIGRYGAAWPLTIGPWVLPAGAKPKTMSYLSPMHSMTKGSPIHTWILQGNLLQQWFPNFGNTERVLNDPEQTDFVMCNDIFMTTTAMYADIVLPSCSLFEKDDLVGSAPFSYIEMQNKAIEPLFESKSDLEIYAGIAKRLGVGDWFDQPAESYLRQMLAAGDDTVKGITFEQLRREGVVRGHVPDAPPVPRSNGQYGTPTGRAQFYLEELIPFDAMVANYLEPELKTSAKYPLVLNNAHSKYRVHSTYANVPWLLEINPYPLAEINGKDAQVRGIKDGDWVEVVTASGSTVLQARISEASRPGTLRISEGWWNRQFKQGSFQNLSVIHFVPRQEHIYQNNGAPLGGWILGTTVGFYEQPCDVHKWQGVTSNV